MPNTYSRTWFQLFLETRPYTEQEVAFILRNLPNPPYSRLLDLGCGQGRIANRLAQEGYRVVGVDLDRAALGIARENAPAGVEYICQDMRQIDKIPGQFDAVLSIWQSFGYFDEATNRRLLAQIRRKLCPRGRLILDIYNRAYWRRNQGERIVERKGERIRISSRMEGNRLFAELNYAGKETDTFEWQLYTLEEIEGVAGEFGLKKVLACTEYDERKPVTEEKPQMQIVFESTSLTIPAS